MTSELSFGNYRLLKQMGAGFLPYAPPQLGALAPYVVIVGTRLALTPLGIRELRKDPPAFPKLGKIEDYGICPRCDHPYPMTLCVGESR